MDKFYLSDDELLRQLKEEENNQPVGTTQKRPNNTPVSEKKKKRNYRYDSFDKNNPYKSESTLDLDDEYDNGFRQIETSILMSLLKKDLTVNEMKIFFYILHKTRGYSNPKNKWCYWENHISKKDILRDLGIPRSTIDRTMKSLREKQMIYSYNHPKYEKTDITGINYRYDTWK